MHCARSRRFIAIHALLGMLVLALIWLPYVMAYVWKLEFLTTGNESLAYRYFLSERAWLGHPSFIWQGHLTTVIQNAIYAALQLPIAAALDFRRQLQAFAASTIVMTLLTTSLFFMIALCDKHLRISDKVLVGFVATFPIYSIHELGLSSLFLPDYYAMNAALSVATAWITLRVLRTLTAEDSDLFLSIAVGVLCGLWASNKVTSMLLLLPAVVVLIARSPRNIIMVGMGASITLGTILSIYYIGNVQDILGFPLAWIKTVVDSQGEGSGNLSIWLKQTFQNQYGVIFLFTILCGIIGSLCICLQRVSHLDKTIIGTCWLVFAGFCLVVVKRPSGSTMFEATLAWTVLSCIWLGMIPRATIRHAAITAAILALAISMAATAQSNLSSFTTSHADADIQWELFDRTIHGAHGHPILVVLASNDYGSGGVFELLQKGVADFPTWHISERGEQLIDRHFPGLRFINEYEGTIFKHPIPKDTVVVWFNREDFPPLAQRVPELAHVLNSADYTCSVQPIPHHPITAYVCDPK